jgi:porphobilinogen deaminase
MLHPMRSSPLRIGTRASPLALAQTDTVRRLLLQRHPDLATAGAIEVVAIRTSGDRVQDRTLAELGGKGLFTRELDDAMLSGAIDLAVHSVKDVPTWLPEGLLLAAFLPREDPRDALITRGAPSLAALPAGSVVGTASLRRQAQVVWRRSDLRVIPFRGNVETRLAKLAAGEADATLLALAGLRRLGLADRATAILDADEMLPAVGQGAIGITCRETDDASRDLLAAIDDARTGDAVAAERAMLAVLDGSCRTPIGGLAETDRDGGLWLRGLVARLAGERRGATADALRLGADLGAELRARAGPGLLAAEPQ